MFQYHVFSLCLTDLHFHTLPQRAFREWKYNRFRPHTNLFNDTVLRFVDRGMTLDRGAISARIEEVNEDKKEVKAICRREIEKLLRMGAEITEMTHTCKLSGIQRLCRTTLEMRKSWCEAGDEGNVKAVLWMFHQLPWGTHQAITLRERSHQDLVEEVVKAELNIDFKASEEECGYKTRNCIQQVYTMLLNNRKQDIMRKGQGNLFDIQAFLKYKGGTTEKKNYRSKTVFYWTGINDEGKYQEHKVRTECCIRYGIVLL